MPSVTYYDRYFNGNRNGLDGFVNGAFVLDKLYQYAFNPSNNLYGQISQASQWGAGGTEALVDLGSRRGQTCVFHFTSEGMLAYGQYYRPAMNVLDPLFALPLGKAGRQGALPPTPGCLILWNSRCIAPVACRSLVVYHRKRLLFARSNVEP